MKTKPAVPERVTPVNAKWRKRRFFNTCLLSPLIVNCLVFAAPFIPPLHAAGSCDSPPTGVVGWWAGDGNAGDLMGSNNATLQGGATATATGFVGQAFSFDGASGYARIPNSAALNQANFTVEAWVRFSSLDSTASGSSPAGYQYIVFKQNSRSTDFEGIDFGKIRGSGGDYFHLLVTSASAQTAEVLSTTKIATGVWYHVAAVRGANFIQIYVNGQLEGQTSVSFAQNYGTLPLYFGTSGQSYWDHKFAGNLDEVSLYNRPLAASEIAAIYAAGASGKCKGASPARITSQPQSQTVAQGSTATFTVSAGGTAPLSYQWKFNGAAIANATGATLSLPNVQPAAAGNYIVIVTNSLGAATSAVAVLTVVTPPTIVTQPRSQTVAVGANVTFTVAASGTAPLSYQWQFNSTAISGATATSLTLNNVPAAKAGNYAVIVANSGASVTSSTAVLTVTGPPVIVTQPQSQSVVAGANVSFSVSASGTAPLSYQWTFNSGNLSGATGSTLTLSGVQSGNAGNYAVTVRNSVGSTNSASATLTVQPAAGTVTINGALTYQVIDGFGVNANHRSWNNNELKPVLDALIDQAGISLFHVIFDNNNWEQSNDNGNANSMNWTYYDSIYSQAEFQKMWSTMAYLNSRGITNGLVPDFEGPVANWMGGLTLASGYENEYAETIASLLIYARSAQNLKFSTVGPVNEPDITYSGIHMSGSSQYVTVMHDLAVQLNNNGMSDVKFSGPDLATTSTSWLSAIMKDSLVMGKMAHFGLHSYQNETTDASGVYNFIKQSSYPNTHFWMTEFNVWCASCQNSSGGNNTWSYARGMASFLLSLLNEGASAGIVWEGYDSQYVDFNPSTGGNNAPHWSYWGLMAVDNINASTKTYTPRKGFYTMAQFAKFIRPGSQRINVNSSSSPLNMLAFYNANSRQFTITGVNTTSSSSSLSCVLTSLPSIPSLDLYYTSSSANLAKNTHVTVNNNAFSVVIPADCVFTLTYSNAGSAQVVSPTAAAPYFLTPSSQNGAMQLSVAATSGAICQIQISTDLVNWQAVTNIVSTNGTVQFTDTKANNFSQRFYRAVLVNE